ncbi:MAG: 3-methyl-2-oxobutanoate hydroxymethyltransferase [Candidatus Marinamargulisbacteria bacterium]|jgi:3-methyl-2-oxobutanoate hydroxymethyltransferase
MKLQPFHMIDKKRDGEKILMLTAFDFITSKVLNEVGVDIILVGDSLGNVFSGFENTLPVTIDHIIYHTQAVSRANSDSLLVADMPFLSYQVSIQQAKANAGRLLKEGGAQAVKIEINNSELDYVKNIVDMGIPVMAHVGFTPQSVYQLGGYKVQGRENSESEALLERAKQLEAIGCFAIVLEMVPNNLAKKITDSVSIPTIGIGAGKSCDGQVLVTQDLLNMTGNKTPRFVKHYGNMYEDMKRSLNQFKDDVKKGQFPEDQHTFD